MNLRKIYIVIVLLLSFSSAIYASGCEKSLKSLIKVSDSSEKVFQALEELEKEIEITFAELAKRYEMYPESIQDLEELSRDLSRITTALDRLQTKVLGDEVIDQSQTKDLSLEVVKLRGRISSFSVSEISTAPKKITWEDILMEPHLIEADKIYKVELYSGGVLSISFSNKIVREVIRHDDNSRALFIKKALPQIAKGIMGGASKGSGLKRLKINKSIIELAVIGKDAGRIRLGGYMNNNVLRMVHWVSDSDHSSTSYIMRFRDSVLSAMD